MKHEVMKSKNKNKEINQILRYKNTHCTKIITLNKSRWRTLFQGHTTLKVRLFNINSIIVATESGTTSWIQVKFPGLGELHFLCLSKQSVLFGEEFFSPIFF